MRGLYVHLPFCRSKCPYCGFYSEAGKDAGAIRDYLKACLKSAAALENKVFDTIYIGGGTPSSLPVQTLAEFTKKLLSVVRFTGKEFSIEANPESVTDGFVSFIKNGPATRVSLGVQSLNDGVLKKLGRIHGSRKALKAAEKLLESGASLNTDMIFDIPGVSRETIFDTAERLSALGPDHISAYSYSSEDTGYLSGFNEDETLYEDIEVFFEGKGYEKYEISNFAKPGKESLHNMIYWTGEEYAGIGAGAHSMLYSTDGFRIRYLFPQDMETYIKDPLTAGALEKLDNETALAETIIFGLRMKKGIKVGDAEKRFGKISPNLLNNINKYAKQGLLKWNSEYLKATKRGASVLDCLSMRLWP